MERDCGEGTEKSGGRILKKQGIAGIAGYLAVLLGAVMIFAGVFRGEPGTVLAKASQVCMECIGIG